VDWNLLAALDVPLAEGSATAAAERLHLSVPATSRTLSRIRQTIGDPILVRAGRGLVPTPRALAFQQRLHRLVEEAHALVEACRDVDVGSLERTFTIRANDSLISLLTAGLVERIRAAAPASGCASCPRGRRTWRRCATGSSTLTSASSATSAPSGRSCGPSRCPRAAGRPGRRRATGSRRGR
jgi:DNA-binding transcriptional LysR family regulator